MKYQIEKIFFTLISILLISSCASQLPKGGQYVDSFTSDPSCNATTLDSVFISEPIEFWKNRINSSTKTVNKIINSNEFAKICQSTSMNKTKGISVQEVCKHITCSGQKVIKYGFFYDKSTSAIARELNDGLVEINTAKPQSGAGNPGNIAHEFTHTLGYKHFTNFSWLGKYSVPYEIGGIVQNISEKKK